MGSARKDGRHHFPPHGLEDQHPALGSGVAHLLDKSGDGLRSRG